MDTNQDKIADVMRERKKKILGNVRFIGELIIQKVLSSIVSSLCVLDLLNHFFEQLHMNQPNSKYLAEIFMEAIIELIEKIGERFEQTKSTGKSDFVERIANVLKSKENSHELSECTGISCDEFF